MHILSQNLFKFSCDQGGIVMVTLQAPYKKELEAKYLRQVTSNYCDPRL